MAQKKKAKPKPRKRQERKQPEKTTKRRKAEGTNDKGGRPPLLEAAPEVVEEILKNVRAGHNVTVACGAAGITRECYYHWKELAAQGREPYASFLTALRRAEDEAEVTLGAKILAGDGAGRSFGPAKAALEFLQRARPRRWSARLNVTLDKEVDTLLDHAKRICSPEDFRRLLEAVTTESGGEEAP
jgi:hypothetical protein